MLKHAASSSSLRTATRKLIQRSAPAISSSARSFSKFLKKPSAPVSRAPAIRQVDEVVPVSDAVIEGPLEGEGPGQYAAIPLRAGDSIRVDPAAIISVPAGVEVKPVDATIPAQPGVATPLATAESPLVVAEISLPPQNAPTSTRGRPQTLSVEVGPEVAAYLFPVNMDDVGQDVFVAHGSFLAGSATVAVSSEQPQVVPAPGTSSTRIAGLHMMRVQGPGNVILKCHGSPIERELLDGEHMYVTAPRILAVEPQVQISGGEGILLTTLTGPGKVLLSTLPNAPSLAVESVLQGQASGTGAGGVLGSQPGGLYSGGMGGGLGSQLLGGMAMGAGMGLGSAMVGHMLGPQRVEHVHTDGGSTESGIPPAEPDSHQPEMTNDLPPEESSGGGGFFGGLFGGDEGGDDGGDDGDW